MYFYNKIAYCWGLFLFVCFNLSGQPVPFDWQPYCTYIQSHFWGICSSHNLLSHPWLISFSHTFNLSAANPRAQPSQSIQRPKPFSPPPLIEIAAIFHLDSLSRHLTSLLFLTSAFPSHLEWFFKKKKKFRLSPSHKTLHGLPISLRLKARFFRMTLKVLSDPALAISLV